jgi:hypothetical protein
LAKPRSLGPPVQAFDTVGGFADPNQQLSALTWNIGSLGLRFKVLTALLLCHAPHIVCLQDAGGASHTLAGVRGTLRDLGYYVHMDKSKGLVTAWRRGLNMAPYTDDIGDFNINSFALQLRGNLRLSLRNIHAPSGGLQSVRTTCLEAVDGLTAGDLHLTLGDFNQKITNTASSVSVTPANHTFRRREGTPFITSIDGALASHLLAHGATATCVNGGDAQHAPVLLTFATSAVTHHFVKWSRKGPTSAQWDDGLRSDFDLAVSRQDTNLAWKFGIWVLVVPPTIQSSLSKCLGVDGTLGLTLM